MNIKDTVVVSPLPPAVASDRRLGAALVGAAGAVGAEGETVAVVGSKVGAGSTASWEGVAVDVAAAEGDGEAVDAVVGSVTCSLVTVVGAAMAGATIPKVDVAMASAATAAESRL
ncbi:MULTISPECIES: hypothetical protein [unclassified Arthrobacter]|uniref:hypothetical protein n=1 Tax=unclassified Arthrobacter TaxID=235627 RepID=UPI001C84D96F|nr:hypothetical protein [Arthrobacter sp. MAHUQ-56]MBX7445462.1 hypothetical protein [Arthrobacter sp. MAHUQ-56]